MKLKLSWTIVHISHVASNLVMADSPNQLLSLMPASVVGAWSSPSALRHRFKFVEYREHADSNIESVRIPIFNPQCPP